MARIAIGLDPHDEKKPCVVSLLSARNNWKGDRHI